jgi:hypothetical protein
MDPLIGKALLGLGSSLGSSLLGNRGAKRRQQLADQNNIKFWQMQNKYNTPKAQMARLKEAGLNPALIYGSGATNTGVAGSIAPSKPAPYNIKDPTPPVLQSMMLQSQIKLQNSQANKNDVESARISGITPAQVQVQQQKAIQEALNTSILSTAAKAKAQLTLEKLLQEQQNSKNVKSRVEYEIRLRKMGISPTGSTGVNILKALMLGAQYITDKFLTDPGEEPPKINFKAK